MMAAYFIPSPPKKRPKRNINYLFTKSIVDALRCILLSQLEALRHKPRGEIPRRNENSRDENVSKCWKLK